MTLITFSDGSVVMRDGKVGTEQACCCGGCCCIDGQKDPSKPTKQDCEAAGGTWNAGKDCGNPCFCCEYKWLCVEQVWSYYQFDYSVKNAFLQPIRQSDMIPAGQPVGTVLVWSSYQEYQSGTGVQGCAGTSPGRQNRFDSGHCYVEDACNEWTTAYGTQWYYRARIIDSCDDCSATEYAYPLVPPGTEEECEGYSHVWSSPCFTGTDVVSCTKLSPQSCQSNGQLKSCLESLELSICADPNPLP